MPACTLHLVAFHPSSSPSAFISTLRSSTLTTLLIAKVIRWIIRPEHLSVQPLLHPASPWDLFFITLGTDPLPSEVQSLTAAHWTIPAGIPSRLTTNFITRNASILHPAPDTPPPPLTGSLTNNPHTSPTSSQSLELSPDLQSWIRTFRTASYGTSAVSMLNLLAFKPGMKDSYLKYGAAFASSIGAKRGGNAKLVGNVIGSQDGWDEIAVAHYPSIDHFADMLASKDYQEVNHRDRLPSLRDTCILCTSELAVEEEMMGTLKRGSKL